MIDADHGNQRKQAVVATGQKTVRKTEPLYIPHPKNPFVPSLAKHPAKTKEERINRLLRKYGRSRSLFRDNANLIKPEVLMCISRADSWMWRATHPKTPYNIMNYGNNDRGDTLNIGRANSVRSASRAMSYGKYMWWHEVVGTLSGGGRAKMGIEWCSSAKSPKKCYATSPYNRNVNVLNCLSYIYQKPIRENFPIRK